ncbi:MAG: sodium ion-translocating decarboxylase subunit beta, partial [Lepagella sp.]
MILLESNSLGHFLSDSLQTFWHFTGFYNCEWTNLVMLLVGCFFIYLAIKRNVEPLLLVPNGFGM